MATDIAFALGVLYLLGDRVPFALKIFLTALAITDDLGAVLVIALFYTSDINLTSLVSGAVFLVVLLVANRTGVRSTLFYALVGIGGLWLAFLMSGVHATIAAVLAAFTIPADVKVTEVKFSSRMSELVEEFRKATPNDVSIVTEEQHHILQDIRDLSKHALTPLQRLEHALHPWVSFFVMPIFAFSNAGIDLSGDLFSILGSPVTLGVAGGLFIGKVIGVTGMVFLFVRMRWADLPAGVSSRHILGAGFLSAIGFTMSLFIAGLAFTDPQLMVQAKVGIFAASVTASLVGYFVVKGAK
jgi:NhaA family Na+:H+ antiporter